MQVLLSQEIGGEYTYKGRDRRVQTSCLLSHFPWLPPFNAIFEWFTFFHYFFHLLQGSHFSIHAKNTICDYQF